MEIRIRDLSKAYRGGVQALQGVNLSISSGMFGLLGPNGAGKTTFMRVLAGIMRPTSGEVILGGHSLATHEGRQAVKKTLGYLPQEFGVYPDLSGYEFLDYIAILKGLHNSKERRQRVESLLEAVSLTGAARRKLKTYSGGMKRRIGIAQALLNDPQLLIVDEPTAGLDPEERIRFRNLLADLSSNRTVLLSTHIVEDIAQACRNLAILGNGRVLFQGTTEQLVREVRGKVWVVTTSGAKPEGDYTIVSTLNMGNTYQYRIVGMLSSRNGDFSSTTVEPTLEDGYVWLMHAREAAGSVRVS